MKKILALVLTVLLAVGGAVTVLAEAVTLPDLDTFTLMYSLYAIMLESEGFETPEIFTDDDGDDLAMVSLDNDVVIVLEFVPGTRELSEIMVYSGDILSNDDAVSTFMYAAVLSLQASGAMTDGSEIVSMLKGFGLNDPESMRAGILGQEEASGISIVLYITEEVGGLLRLSYPE